MIKIQGVNKTFNGNQVLSDLDVSIASGEITRITGANGCGKSTLLKIIAGLLIADSGTVEIEKEANIGALIENPSFIENETLLYNLKFLYNLKNTFDYEKVKSLVDYFQLDLHSKTNIKKYSVGMQQKAGIIQAIMEDQNIILFDEPTRGLDIASVEKFCDLIAKLHEEKKTIIICAHDGVDGIVFDRTLLLKNGAIHEMDEV